MGLIIGTLNTLTIMMVVWIILMIIAGLVIGVLHGIILNPWLFGAIIIGVIIYLIWRIKHK